MKSEGSMVKFFPDKIRKKKEKKKFFPDKIRKKKEKKKFFPDRYLHPILRPLFVSSVMVVLSRVGCIWITCNLYTLYRHVPPYRID